MMSPTTVTRWTSGCAVSAFVVIGYADGSSSGSTPPTTATRTSGVTASAGTTATWSAPQTAGRELVSALDLEGGPGLAEL